MNTSQIFFPFLPIICKKQCLPRAKNYGYMYKSPSFLLRSINYALLERSMTNLGFTNMSLLKLHLARYHCAELTYLSSYFQGLLAVNPMLLWL